MGRAQLAAAPREKEEEGGWATDAAGPLAATREKGRKGGAALRYGGNRTRDLAAATMARYHCATDRISTEERIRTSYSTRAGITEPTDETEHKFRAARQRKQGRQEVHGARSGSHWHELGARA